MKVAVVSIVDEGSEDHWSTFVLQASKLFLPNAQKEFFLFSNRTSPDGLSQSVVGRQSKIQWSSTSLHDFDFPVLASANLGEFDYIFHLSTRLSFHRQIGEEILPDSSNDLVAVQHPGFVNLPPNRLPFERNPGSAAYVAKSESSFYCTDQVFGASPKEYTALIKWIQGSMDEDQRRKLIAKRRFESYFNGYLACHYYSIRHSGYCYPRGWDLGVPKMILCDWSKFSARADYWSSLDESAPQGAVDHGLPSFCRMGMRLLIDGYNLLFQSPFVGRGRGPGWLERSRNQLVGLLHTHINKSTLARTVVVFDASQIGETKDDFRTDRGVSIVFSRLHSEADDLLEDIIRKHSSPKSLTVVSSDHRIQKCAMARRAIIVSSEQFLDDLIAKRWIEERAELRNIKLRDEEIDKGDGPLTEDQVNFWLDEFNQ